MAEKVIIARIDGGIGNQMFVYAAAKRLAHKNSVPLLLDAKTCYESYSYDRPFYLEKFNITAKIAPDNVEDIYLDRGFIRNIQKKYAHRIPYKLRSYIKEEYKYYDKRLTDLKLKHSIYLMGYWQSEKYFKDIEDIIRKEFTFNIEHEDKNKRIAEEMEKSNSVAIHTRRLHYIGNVKGAEPRDDVKGLDISYYHKAIDLIAGKVQNIRLFCFSDYPDWLKENLKTKYPVEYIENEGEVNKEEKCYEDLWLMSNCKHNIIANSSFSWWGAWLNNNPDKIVVAPSFGIGPSERTEPRIIEDSIPADWHVIDTLNK